MGQQLLFDHEASAEAFEYIDEVVKDMLHAAATPATVPWRLLVGWLHFHDGEVSSWIRAKVSPEHFERSSAISLLNRADSASCT